MALHFPKTGYKDGRCYLDDIKVDTEGQNK
jgi:hypothetical protein